MRFGTDVRARRRLPVPFQLESGIAEVEAVPDRCAVRLTGREDRNGKVGPDR